MKQFRDLDKVQNAVVKKVLTSLNKEGLVLRLSLNRFLSYLAYKRRR